VGRIKLMTLLVAALSAMTAAGTGAAAAAKGSLTLSLPGAEGRPILPGARLEGDGSFQLAFKLGGQEMKCDQREGVHFQGAVTSSNEAKDRLAITELITEERVCEAPGIEATLYQRSPTLVLSVSSSGDASLTTGSEENIKMALQVFVGERELQCLFEKPRLKGANSATPNAQQLTFAFSAQTASNHLTLNEAGSTPGCPSAISVGLESMHIVSALEQEELLEQKGA
jgi:hypothetical protein